MTARMEGVDGEISRIHFIDPQTEAPKPAPVTAVFKNLTSGTQQVRLRPPNSFVSPFDRAKAFLDASSRGEIVHCLACGNQQVRMHPHDSL